jgi:hypothetical protein
MHTPARPPSGRAVSVRDERVARIEPRSSDIVFRIDFTLSYKLKLKERVGILAELCWAVEKLPGLFGENRRYVSSHL